MGDTWGLQQGELLLYTFLFFSIVLVLYQTWRKLGQTLKVIKPAVPGIKTFVVTDDIQCNIAVNQINEELRKVQSPYALGFDCEWVSMPKRIAPIQPISLLQLCTPTGYCYLFRLNKLKNLPSSLCTLLESKALKLGVNCALDAKLIEQNYHVKVNNYFDLRYLQGEQASLALLAETIIGITLDKSKSVPCSDWNAEILSEKQVTYAAMDAWVAIEIYKKWSAWKSEDTITFVENKYKNIPFQNSNNKKVCLKQENYNHPLIIPEFARKTQLYDNCWMYAPDGQQLCSCNRRKAEWYVNKGLAKVISEDPFSILLLFEPNSRPDIDADGDFYRQFKNNYCVVCGSDEPCLRHYVIPREYRKHFPVNMKSHKSHDVVLTCLNCHAKSKIYMVQLKNELAELCDASYIGKSSNFKKMRKIKNVCASLLKFGEIMPPQRRECLEEYVKEFFGLEDINNTVLTEILSNDLIEEEIESHGKKVVEYFAKNRGGIMELELLFRKQFLQHLKPQFLPTAWCIHHNHKKLLSP